MAEAIRWDDYIFEILSDTSGISDGGVFIFAGKQARLFNDVWVAYFIGKTGNLEYHLKASQDVTSVRIKAKKLGATHIHFLRIGPERRSLVTEHLINIYQPLLNKEQECNQPTPEETTTMATELNETKLKLEMLYQYEKHYLELVKNYKEEIKFANTLQEDLRRERTQFFTQTLKDVMQNMKTAEIDKSISAQWVKDLVDSYTKSIDLSSDLAKTHVIEIISLLTTEAKHEALAAGLDNIGKKDNAK